MKPKWSLTFSQESSIIPILSHINPVHAPSYFFNFHFNNILQSTPKSFKWSLPQFSVPKPYIHLSSPRMFHMHRPSHSSWFDHPGNIWWGLHSMKLGTVQLSPFPRYCRPYRSKYLPWHHFLEHPQPIDTASRPYNKGKNYSSECFNLYIFG